MTLFVFEVSPGWNFCGGMCVAHAGSFERAVELLLAFKDKNGDLRLEGHKFYKTVEEIPDLRKIYYAHKPEEFFYKKEEGWDEWVLISQFETYEAEEFCCASFNYA